MYHFLDIFFIIFHTSLVIFNIFGWVWKKTRLLHLVSLLFTAFSWFVLGIFFGWGYCFLTDLHWKILDKLGKTNIPDSYIQYLIERLTGLKFDAKMIDNIVLIVFLVCLVISIFLNVRDRLTKTKTTD